MRACWYERPGPPHDVLTYGDMAVVQPGPGEVTIRVQVSGINPGDVKKRQDAFGLGLPYPRIVPHSDGAGIIHSVGPGVDVGRVGERVWCFGAQTYRPFGTAAEYCTVPGDHAVPLPAHVSVEQGALLGIPGITAHQAVHASGPLAGKVVLVQGGAGAVGSIAVRLAKRAGAFVVATVRKAGDETAAESAGADHVLLGHGSFADRILQAVPRGVDHIVEVAFGANVADDERILAQGGSIAVYASDTPEPEVPFWPLVFKNVTVHFLGSDDFTTAQKQAAAAALTEAASDGWLGLSVAARYGLEETADAHQHVERGPAGRVIVTAE